MAINEEDTVSQAPRHRVVFFVLFWFFCLASHHVGLELRRRSQAHFPKALPSPVYNGLHLAYWALTLPESSAAPWITTLRRNAPSSGVASKLQTTDTITGKWPFPSEAATVTGLL